jgi:hypothetical protein
MDGAGMYCGDRLYGDIKCFSFPQKTELARISGNSNIARPQVGRDVLRCSGTTAHTTCSL